MATKKSKKSTKPKVSPMYSRVVVMDHLGDATRRSQVLECLATLDFTGVLEEVRAHVRIEQGATARQARVLPSRVKQAVSFGLQVFDTLEMVVSAASMWLAMREAGSTDTGKIEAAQLLHLQALMDLVFKAQSSFDATARIAVAGLGGHGPWRLDQRLMTSGLEAAVTLANDVRLTVVGVVENPFARFLPEGKAFVREWSALPGESRRAAVAGNAEVLTRIEADGTASLNMVAPTRGRKRKPSRPQTGREKPLLPEETDPRDVAIMRAMKSGITGKRVAPATGKFGPPSSQSHVEKRRAEMHHWEWVTAGRDATLTEEGSRWLSEIPAAE